MNDKLEMTMTYTLFTDFITLQALLKELGIIQSGGAIKGFLAQTEVFLNGQEEQRRGKKLRVGDVITIPSQHIRIELVAPSQAEKTAYEAEKAEKERVAKMVKQMNQQAKKAQTKQTATTKSKRVQATSAVKAKSNHQKPIRFPGL